MLPNRLCLCHHRLWTGWELEPPSKSKRVKVVTGERARFLDRCKYEVLRRDERDDEFRFAVLCNPFDALQIRAKADVSDRDLSDPSNDSALDFEASWWLYHGQMIMS